MNFHRALHRDFPQYEKNTEKNTAGKYNSLDGALILYYFCIYLVFQGISYFFRILDLYFGGISLFLTSFGGLQITGCDTQRLKLLMFRRLFASLFSERFK